MNWSDLFKMLKVFGVSVFHQVVVVEEGDASVLRVPADVNDLAALREDVRRQHRQGQVRLDDSWRGQTKIKIFLNSLCSVKAWHDFRIT
jgi:hypothetical protein